MCLNVTKKSGNLVHMDNNDTSFKERKCVCGHSISYNEIYDAEYCLSCNSWMSEKCPNPDCFHCSNRPYFPMKIPFEGRMPNCS